MVASSLLTRERLVRYPLVTLGVLLASGAALAVLRGPEHVFGGDFRAFYTGAALLVEGRGRELYELAAQREFQVRVLGGDPAHLSVWMSPIWVAGLLAPLAFVPFWAAWAAFALLNGACVAWGLGALARELRTEARRPGLALGLLTYFPALSALLIGQMTGIFWALTAGFVLALRRGRDVLAGLCLAGFVCKPQLAFGLGAMLLGARRVRPLAVGGVVAGSVVLASELAQPGSTRAYLENGRTVAETLGSSDYPRAGMHGSAEFWLLLVGGWSARAALVLGLVGCAVLCGVLALSWRKEPWRPATPRWDLSVAASLTLGLLAAPHLYAYDLALLGVPLCLALGRVPAAGGLPLGGGRLLIAFVLVWCAGLVGPALTAGMLEGSERLLGVPIALQSGVLVIGYLAWRLAEQARREPSSSGAQ